MPGTGSGTGWPRAAGSNLSFAAYRDAIGDPYIARRQQDGVKWIVANKDVPLALLEIAKRQRSAPEYLRSLRGTRMDGLHALDDPLPGLLERRHGRPADPDARAAGEGRRVTTPELTVFIGAPDAFAPRADWVLQTLLAPLGRRAAVTRDPAASERRRAGVRRRAGRRRADDPLRRRRHGAPRRRTIAAGRRLRGAREPATAPPSPPGPPTPTPASLSPSTSSPRRSSLLACWDERTTTERDKYGRLPFSASVFAANPALKIDEPAVDRYAELLRGALAPRLAELGLDPLPAAGSPLGSARPLRDRAHPRPRQPVALDAARVRRGRLPHRSARRVTWTDAPSGRELGDGADWLVRHLPRHSDPFWTFPQLLRGEDVRGVSSTFYVIARHTHKQDGNQPETYRRKIPEALELVTAAGREIGLHGNDADRLALAEVTLDRDDLAARAGRPVTGVRYHYLRALYHETLPLLEQAGFTYDTTHGVRRARGLPLRLLVPVPALLPGEERPLELVELPLAVMDGTLQEPHYRGPRGGGGGARRRRRAGTRPAQRRRGEPALAQQPLRPARLARLRQGLLAPARPGAGARRLVQQRRRHRRPLEGSDDVTRVLHLSVVHKPDDPRIYERECRTLARGRLRGHVHGPRRRAGARRRRRDPRAVAGARPQHPVPQLGGDHPRLCARSNPTSCTCTTPSC